MTRQTTYRLLIVDDHPLILSGIQALLEGQADLDVIGTAQTAQGALDAIKLRRPDLVIADGTLPLTAEAIITRARSGQSVAFLLSLLVRSGVLPEIDV